MNAMPRFLRMSVCEVHTALALRSSAQRSGRGSDSARGAGGEGDGGGGPAAEAGGNAAPVCSHGGDDSLGAAASVTTSDGAVPAGAATPSKTGAADAGTCEARRNSARPSTPATVDEADIESAREEPENIARMRDSPNAPRPDGVQSNRTRESKARRNREYEIASEFALGSRWEKKLQLGRKYILRKRAAMPKKLQGGRPVLVRKRTPCAQQQHDQFRFALTADEF
eukprot:6199017-Pleurochrysis_carterae.AAC.1